MKISGVACILFVAAAFIAGLSVGFVGRGQLVLAETADGRVVTFDARSNCVQIEAGNGYGAAKACGGAPGQSGGAFAGGGAGAVGR